MAAQPDPLGHGGGTRVSPSREVRLPGITSEGSTCPRGRAPGQSCCEGTPWHRPRDFCRASAPPSLSVPGMEQAEHRRDLRGQPWAATGRTSVQELPRPPPTAHSVPPGCLRLPTPRPLHPFSPGVPRLLAPSPPGPSRLGTSQTLGSKEPLQGGESLRCTIYQPSLDGAEWRKDLGHPPARNEQRPELRNV